MKKVFGLFIFGIILLVGALSFSSAFGYDFTTTPNRMTVNIYEGQSQGNFTNLSEMVDTDINDATTGDNEVLTWNDTSKKWFPQSAQAVGDSNCSVDNSCSLITYDSELSYTAIWDAVFNASFDDRDQQGSGNASWNESRASTLYTDITWNYNQTLATFNTWNSIWSSIFNQTYHDYAENVSKNYTERTYNTYDLRWTDTYNLTYHDYAENVSLNWTEIIFGTYDNRWFGGNSSWNESYADSKYFGTYNSTYDDYKTNVSKNYTEEVFDTYDARWSGGTGDNESWNESYADSKYSTGAHTVIWDAVFNASFDDRDQQGTGNASWNETRANTLYSGIEWDYNQTTATFNLYNDIWTSTFNTTYHDYAENVSKNYTEEVFNTWDGRWFGGAGNASWNESYADNKYLDTFNATYDNYKTNVSKNYTEEVFNNWNSIWSGGNSSWNESYADNKYADIIWNYNQTLATFNTWNNIWISTFNTTYHNYAENVSKNYTEEVFDTYDARWSGGTGDNESWNESYANTLHAPNTTKGIQYLINNTEVYSTFNSTYDKFKLNVSKNYTERTYNTYNSIWGGGNASWNESYADSKYLDTFNQTYDNYKTNVSKNYTEETFNNWNSIWSGGNSSWNESYADGKYLDTFNQTYHDYANNVSLNYSELTYNTYDLRWTDTYNLTYHNYLTNVSLNYTEIVFNTWDARWSGGNESWNESYADSKYLDTFNQTYHDYAENVSLNWTEIIFNTYNDIWSSIFNQTYHDYAENVSKNYTEETFNNWNSIWSGGNSSWNESYADGKYLDTFNQTYHDYAENVSLNYTEIVFDMWNSTWTNNTQLSEDDVESYIFDNDNTDNLDMNSYNITSLDCIVFDSGGKICSA